MGSRKVPFSRVLSVEQDDFMEIHPKSFLAGARQGSARLRYGYYIKCVSVVKNV